MAKFLRSAAAGSCLALVLFGTSSGHAQAPQPAPAAPSGQQTSGQSDQQPPVFRAGINFVRVDVIVSDRSGNPVGDLKPEDFEVTEDGKAQKVETFKLISLDGGRTAALAERPREIRTDFDEETEAAKDDVRLFAFFLDDYHVRRESSIRAREQLAKFVDTQIGPSDMIGIMYPLEAIASVRMTRNHDAVTKGLLQFEGRKYDYTPRNEMEQQYIYYPTSTVEDIRNDVSLSALKSLIIHLGGLKEGRKALVLVSEGYSSLLPPQLRDQQAAVPGSGNVAAGNPMAGDNPLEQNLSDRARLDMEERMRDVTDLANRNNVTIYAVDPRGLAASEFGIDQNISNSTDQQFLTNSLETLRTLAFNTDGRAIVNSNDLASGLKQIVSDTSAYYLLGYTSTFTATDGKFHEIKVRVKRPGVQVRSRKGYWAYTNEDVKKATAPPAPEMPKAYSAALASISTPPRSRIVRTWLGTERAADGKTHVTFVWEPISQAATGARAAAMPARISLTAIAPDGSPVYRGRTAPAAAAGPAGGHVAFDAPPGKIQLRVSVESADAEVLDSEVREVDLPDFSTTPLALGTPRVYRARTVREYQQLKADPDASPTAVREFTRAERVFVRISAYAGDAAPALTARILNRGGQPIATVPV
ncbi:MAG: VWA domain-containing protein, partial [Acidobacteriaceae bacterium]|nr:VWA domain-containing protein [Acidobacteriaceae bacterium]